MLSGRERLTCLLHVGLVDCEFAIIGCAQTICCLFGLGLVVSSAQQTYCPGAVCAQNGDRAVLNTELTVGQQSNTKPKLVRVIARLNTGGPARQVCLLHGHLTSAFDCHLIFGELAAGEHDMSYLLSSEQNVTRLAMMSREISLWSDAKAFWTIFRTLRKERPDIVHTHTAKAGVLGRTAAWLAGTPVIVHTYHGHIFYAYFGPLRNRFHIAIERLLGWLTTRVIAISESQARDLCNTYRIVPERKISVVHNGFDLHSFSEGSAGKARRALGLKAEDFVVAWVGRVVPIKGVGLLDETIRKAAAANRRICFLVAGDGSEMHKLKSLAENSPNVRWLGWQRDVDTIWKAADVALLTSRNEGTPTALIESMAAGLPFVATNVGGVRDLALGPLQALPEGFGFQASNGFLTSRKPEALLYCLEQLQQNADLKRKMGEAGKSFALQRFSAERLVAEITLLYRDLMRNAGSVPRSSQKIERGSSKTADIV